MAPAETESFKPYMVIFKDSADKAEIEAQIKSVEEKGGKIKQRFDSEIMRGFAATMPVSHASELTTASLGGKHGSIEYVEADSEVHTQ